ncbi:MAG: chromosome segregation protein SMC [Actinobacteria bacterium]|nr:chromosome segregation protein SMC [Actinomycetota bacterium]
MFLKSLTIKGFKSFADTTVLDFEPGVTVVVGPNGSGKSNVVDAIAWVLGAQGPSTVRSGKMEDVVFAGTSERKALGRAEVSLVIDNSVGLLPVEFTELTITRILYRAGDSEYSMNGVPCRLLDIQELLSDAGVGRQQHIIVAQGQIDQVLNARPEDRRTIIEEAAGILKYRRRKERSERRLSSTEANLTRLQDLQREVRRQLRPLEKQADAAKRHGDVVSELHSLRLHLAGREIASLRIAQTNSGAEREQLSNEEIHLRSHLAELDERIVRSESKLIASGDGGMDLLPRAESLRERCKGLLALVNERTRAVERDKGALLAADVLATLEAEQSRILIELENVSEREALVAPKIEEVKESETLLKADRDAADLEEMSGIQLGASDRAGEVRGELVALRSTVGREVAEESRLRNRLEKLSEQVQIATKRFDELQVNIRIATEAELPLVASLDRANEKEKVASRYLDAAEVELREAIEDQRSWQARTEILELSLSQARNSSGLDELEGAKGVQGLLAELIEIDPGWELAVEAGLGETLSSVVIQDPKSARSALELLREKSTPGAVISAVPGEIKRMTQIVGAPLRQHVRSLDGKLNDLLDHLLHSVVCVEQGWKEAVDGSLENPGLTFVTLQGDRCGPDGWRVGQAGSAVTLVAFEEATLACANANHLRQSAESKSKAALLAFESSKNDLVKSTAELQANDDVLTKASDLVGRTQQDVASLTNDISALRVRLDELQLVLLVDEPRLAELENLLPALEAAESAERDAILENGNRRDVLEGRARELAAIRAQLTVNASNLIEQKERLENRSSEITAQLLQHETELVHAADRRTRIEQIIVSLGVLSDLLLGHTERLEAEVTRLREKRQKLSQEVRLITSELETSRRERSDVEKRLLELRELIGRVDVADAERRLKLENVVQLVRSELEVEPDVAISHELPALPEGTSAAARVRELDADLRRMGPINPLALQEFEELSERHDFVAEQLEDVKKGRRELNKVISAIDEEIVRVFGSAFADVSENFEELFSTLFPGGQGKLRLTNPNDLLGTGIELEAKPSGKNVRKLSLLSGGERSLTALAFLFAIFRSRPSPFYVMDEVEAALDDVNLHRFLGLIAEFRKEAQLVIVSHQKRTMESADVLYGVSMAPGGASKVLSEKVA